MYIAIILLFISFFTPIDIVDTNLKPYETEFFNTVNKYCSQDKYFHPLQKTVYFAELSKGQIAFCKTNGYTNVNIVINPVYWNNETEDQKFATFWHESFHCYFKAEHSPDPHHFMFAYENRLSKQEVMDQAIALLKEKCK